MSISSPNNLATPLEMVIAATLSLIAAYASDARAENVITGTVTVFDAQGEATGNSADVVVFLDGTILPEKFHGPSATTQISHKGRQFSPPVLPIVAGSKVDFMNDDDIFHNVFSLSEAKTFDLGIYEQGASRLVSFDKPGLVKIHCNIHPKMVSSILVLRNKLFATTDASGNFEISGIPGGEYTLRAWHPYGEEQQRKIDFRQSDRRVDDFELRQVNRVPQHRNKFGKRYRKKY